jgi:4'-phosphopantetheinyl transferase EntD
VPDDIAVTCQRLLALAESLVPPDVSVACVAAGAWQLPDPEARAVAQAVPKRQAEFAGGRTAARQAMQALGMPPVPVPMGDDRAPVWPQGVTGSITHAEGICLAALRRGSGLVGIDLETDKPLEADLHDTILTRTEQELDAKLIFCIKEAAYKAQYALSRTLYGFEDMAVELDGFRWQARFLRDIPPFQAGDRISGSWGRTGGFLLAAAF